MTHQQETGHQQQADHRQQRGADVRKLQRRRRADHEHAHLGEKNSLRALVLRHGVDGCERGICHDVTP